MNSSAGLGWPLQTWWTGSLIGFHTKRLSLLCNAVLVWNTVHMSRIIEQLRATGVTITDEEVALISPLAYAHVIPNGTYFFDRGGEEEASAQSRNS